MLKSARHISILFKYKAFQRIHQAQYCIIHHQNFTQSLQNIQAAQHIFKAYKVNKVHKLLNTSSKYIKYTKSHKLHNTSSKYIKYTKSTKYTNCTTHLQSISSIQSQQSTQTAQHIFKVYQVYKVNKVHKLQNTSLVMVPQSITDRPLRPQHRPHDHVVKIHKILTKKYFTN